MPKTLFDKLWNAHLVTTATIDMNIIYIDRHYIHEVTSPQAFNILRKNKLPVRRPALTTATMDHNVPTKNQHLPIKNEASKIQVEQLQQNCQDFGIELFGLGNPNQGIVHVIGPELGLTQPGMTIVCGDSHTSTHGAFACIAFGIGTSQVAQVLATQSLVLKRPKCMRIRIDGALEKGVTAKDVILYIIAQLGVGGGTGYFLEYAGTVIQNLSMEERMTICNMSIELGARGGLIAVDQKTLDYTKANATATISHRQYNYWKSLHSDKTAKFDKEIQIDGHQITPMITYGTNPGMGIPIDKTIPINANTRSLEYMGFQIGQFVQGVKIDYVFIGSCTNSRIEDLRAAAYFIGKRKKANHVTVWVVPGSQKVATQAKKEGLDLIFEAAGFEFRQPGCSACLAMNEDKIPAKAYCVATSNRNFEGRQGVGARTLLASPLTAVATALAGHVSDPRLSLKHNESLHL
ncbi:MAG: 3-isopropylmalate dehydratase large subunit [Aureispira sp.]|nr:3-isopropylmalate dehydratase large subunit [Aureispira sp.]